MPRHAVEKAIRETQWLVVSDESEEVRLIRDCLGDAGNRVRRVSAGLVRQEVEAIAGPAVVIVSRTATEGPLLTGHQVPVPMIVADASATLDRAVAAMRTGAADYLPGPLAEVPRLRQRLRHAAMKAAAEEHGENRLARLRQAVHQLNAARRTVGKRVDLLCNDFIDGYGEVAREVEHVRQTSNLQSLLGSAQDLEQLLCHAMDWILRQLGDCNIAIYLDNDAGESELAAYMKHTVPGGDGVIDWLKDHMLPRTKRIAGGKTLLVSPEEMLPKIDPLDEEGSRLLDQSFMGVSCRYLGESLGSILVFRRDDEPMTDDHARLLKLVGETFATVITSIVRQEDDEFDEEDQDEDDWWRNGESAPF